VWSLQDLKEFLDKANIYIYVYIYVYTFTHIQDLWLGAECAGNQIDVWSLQDLKEFLDEANICIHMYVYIYIHSRVYIGFVAGCGVRSEADRCVVAAGLERVSRRGEYSLAAAPPKHCAAAGYLRLAHAAGTS